MRNIRFSVSLLIGGICMAMCHSCSTCSRQQITNDITVDLADLVSDSTYINMARTMYYALPTPIELSMLLKSSGIGWQPALLNDPANAAKYLTHQKMALNFGGYITDLAYAGLFEQSQTVLRYKLAIRQLMEGLGLSSSVDLNTMQQLEASINDKDAVMHIISETYASCTSSLNEGDRYSLTLAILTGGWVEGMYIATNSIDENLLSDESRMKQLVVDQILTFDMMWRVMSDFKDISDVADMMNDLSGLANIFDKIYVDQTPNVVTVNDDGKTSDIVASNIIDVTPETFAHIKAQIQNLRYYFTK
jgi:hypothetical protein